MLQIQTTTEKIKLIEYLTLGEIKCWNLKNEHFQKKSPKEHKLVSRYKCISVHYGKSRKVNDKL